MAIGQDGGTHVFDQLGTEMREITDNYINKATSTTEGIDWSDTAQVAEFGVKDTTAYTVKSSGITNVGKTAQRAAEKANS